MIDINAYISPYLDASPPGVTSVDEYEWQLRPLGLGEMRAAGLGEDPNCDPSKSDDRPVIVSMGDGESTPILVWDGVHRIRSSYQTKEESRPALVGIKKQGEIYVDDLPLDLQDLLEDFFGDAGKKMVDCLPTRAIRVSRFPLAVVGNDPLDSRGLEHVEDMKWNYLPPVVVVGDIWLDGRHRIKAVREMGVEWVNAIDLDNLIPKPKKGQTRIGRLLDESDPQVCQMQVRVTQAQNAFDFINGLDAPKITPHI